MIERSTYALGKGASAVFFLLPGQGSAAVRRNRLFSFSVPGIRGMPRQRRRAFWEGEEGGAARPLDAYVPSEHKAGRGSGTGSEPLGNEMDILHMGEAGLWAAPPVMTKARLRANAHACGEGGGCPRSRMVPGLSSGAGRGAIRTGVMSVRRIPVRRPLIAHGEEVCAGTSAQGGAVFSCSCVGPFLREGDSGVSGAVGHPWQVVLRWRGFPGRRRKRGAFCRRETGRGLRGRRGCAFSGKKPRLRPSGAELRGA